MQQITQKLYADSYNIYRIYDLKSYNYCLIFWGQILGRILEIMITIGQVLEIMVGRILEIMINMGQILL